MLIFILHRERNRDREWQNRIVHGGGGEGVKRGEIAGLVQIAGNTVVLCSTFLNRSLCFQSPTAALILSVSRS